MVEIKHIQPNSIAEEVGIGRGDQVVSINGKQITDALDYRFYITHEEIELAVRQGDGETVFEIEKEYDDDLGIVLEDLEMRSCGNACIFCFVFQNPKGLRKGLYFKDEDYRFSFLYGHYTTLTNATQEDLERIVEQRLSPLYISVHVTDPELRKLMLGIKFDDHLFEKIDYLTQKGIELNCQIVLCPELNDGAVLDKTISDLKAYYPMIRSVAIVPVGLTHHRKNLYEIKPVPHEYSLKTIEETDARRELLRKEMGSSFVYLSDEFYIRTDTPIPDNDYYEGFYQLENGVGLTRDFITRFEEELPYLKNPAGRPLNFSLATGTLGAEVLKKYFMGTLNRIPGTYFKLHPVINKFYGPSITVSGLLVGEDIYETLKDEKTGDYIILPPGCLNDDGLFLDDWPLPQLEEKLGKRLIVFPGSFTELFELVEEYETALSDHRR
jgi:putative radical SAM enzyme (TIGR03279 family)